MGATIEIGAIIVFLFPPILLALILVQAFSVKVYIFEEEIQMKLFSKLFKVEFKNVTKISLAPVHGYLWPFGRCIVIYSGKIGLPIPFYFFFDGEDAINFVVSRVKKYSPDAQIQI